MLEIKSQAKFSHKQTDGRTQTDRIVMAKTRYSSTSAVAPKNQVSLD